MMSSPRSATLRTDEDAYVFASRIICEAAEPAVAHLPALDVRVHPVDHHEVEVRHDEDVSRDAGHVGTVGG